MITSEEEERLVLKVVERVLTIMPEVIGNLIANHSSNAKIKEDFYNKYPEFKSHPEIVREIIAKVESDSIGKPYDEILSLAIPRIKDSINLRGSLNTSEVPSKDNLDLSVDSTSTQFGEL